MAGEKQVASGAAVGLAIAVVAGGCKFDAGILPRASQPDAADLIQTRCGSEPDADSIAVYSFEATAGVVSDTMGRHPATVSGVVGSTSGPSGCGAAVEFPTGAGYIVVPDSSEWDLSVGAVEVRVRAAVGDDLMGILSRDAQGAVLPGHVSLFLHPEGTAVLRIQRPEGDVFRCSNQPLPTGEWVHLGVNLGDPIEMYVDGVLAARTGSMDSPGGVVACGSGASGGIDGNDNPWVIGSLSWSSLEGVAAPVERPLAGGAIDEVRISSVRRDF